MIIDATRVAPADEFDEDYHAYFLSGSLGEFLQYLDEAGIPRGEPIGAIRGSRDAFAIGLLAHDPDDLGLDDVAYRAAIPRNGMPEVRVPVCAAYAEAVSDACKIPLGPTVPANHRGLVVSPDINTSFVSLLARDRGSDVRTFLRSTDLEDLEAFELIRRGSKVPIPGIDNRGIDVLHFRRFPTFTAFDQLVNAFPIVELPEDGDFVRREHFEGAGFRWSWPLGSFFEPYFATTAGQPLFDEQLTVLFADLLGVSRVRACSMRAHARWVGGTYEVELMDGLKTAFGPFGLRASTVDRLVSELARRSKWTFSRTASLSDVVRTVACARALLDDPAGYRACFRECFEVPCNWA